MKLVLNYHKPFTCKLQHSVYLLNKKETKDFEKKYGIARNILREYLDCIPTPFRISGNGWVIKNDGYAKESVYIEKSTYKEDKL